MTPREQFIRALTRQPPLGHVPHFELVFFPTMQTLGKIHPCHRIYDQWPQMQEQEKQLHRIDLADLYIDTAKRFDHSAIFIHPVKWGLIEEDMRIMEIIREKSGDEYFLMVHGETTFPIPTGDDMVNFSMRMVDEPHALKKETQDLVDQAFKNAAKYKEHGALDGFAMCADYCFNDGPFMSPAQFSEFVTPYLEQTCTGYRQMDLFSIKHTDGNIMPILDQLVQAGPDALHSLDPQGGVDIAEVKRQYGKDICLIGNVNCGLMDTGTDQQVQESAQYAITHGKPDGGYIFSTSNCVYPGMRLERYEMILDAWRKEGKYPAAE